MIGCNEYHHSDLYFDEQVFNTWSYCFLWHFNENIVTKALSQISGGQMIAVHALGLGCRERLQNYPL